MVHTSNANTWEAVVGGSQAQAELGNMENAMLVCSVERPWGPPPKQKPNQFKHRDRPTNKEI